MAETTLIYYTDNTLEPVFQKKIQDYLVKAAEGKRILSVSQKPMQFGENICLGDIGRSHISLFTQCLEGARAADTKYIALAEHDCLYTAEHFNWIPPRDDIFYYNVHHWFAQWGNKLAGQYSYFRRKAMSQLICNRELFIEAIQEKIIMLKEGAQIKRGQPGACEPGVCDNRKAFIEAKAALAKLKDLGKDKPYQAQAFKTELPNIDIRHGGNFSGNRRARQRCYSIPYWGSFHAVMGEAPPGKWYQEATINNQKMPTRRRDDTNEKRWQALVKNHVPPVETGSKTFIELGCNAGFYCRKAADNGYKAIGIERDLDFIRHACYWETMDPKGVTIIEGDINEYKVTYADILLMANVHYWQTKEQITKLAEQFKQNVRRVVIVGRLKGKPQHLSPVDYKTLISYFSGWVRGSYRKSGKHYCTTFINPWIGDKAEVAVDDIFYNQQLSKSRRFYPSYKKLIETGNPDEYIGYLKWRGFNAGRLKKDLALIADIKANGIKTPLIMENKRVVDGDHRLIIAKVLGHKTIPILKELSDG